ncbi:hypothetical protein, partial [Nostoc sp.]|uniref:hypothetical protein n=1 Tax=Nostoc sp. TaxID=1180 RepID=UPI002FF4D56E
TESFPNSEVKRCCGHDSLGVALRKNSSMPGFIIQLNPPQIIMRRVEFFNLPPSARVYSVGKGKSKGEYCMVI